jgi:hypothetical protein
MKIMTDACIVAECIHAIEGRPRKCRPRPGSGVAEFGQADLAQVGAQLLKIS